MRHEVDVELRFRWSWARSDGINQYHSCTDDARYYHASNRHDRSPATKLPRAIPLTAVQIYSTWMTYNRGQGNLRLRNRNDGRRKTRGHALFNPNSISLRNRNDGDHGNQNESRYARGRETRSHALFN